MTASGEEITNLHRPLEPFSKHRCLFDATRSLHGVISIIHWLDGGKEGGPARQEVRNFTRYSLE